jgi:hypothetical protein
VLELRWWRSTAPLEVLAVALFLGLVVHVLVTRGQFRAVHEVVLAVVALAGGYYVATRLLNRTRLSVRDGVLRVEHGPLPWKRPLELACADVVRLACNPTSRRLEVRTRDGQERALLEGLSPAELVRVERWLERLTVGR